MSSTRGRGEHLVTRVTIDPGAWDRYCRIVSGIARLVGQLRSEICSLLVRLGRGLLEEEVV